MNWSTWQVDQLVLLVFFCYYLTMRIGDPSPNPPEKRSMNEAETLTFLHDRGVRLLPAKDWRPHQPLLYVLEEKIRGETGPLKKIPRDRRPSIVRVDDPVVLNIDSPLTESTDPQRVVYELENHGGQVDYFAIDPNTKQIINVKTSARIKKWDDQNPNLTPYHVRLEALFETNDDLFPKKVL